MTDHPTGTREEHRQARIRLLEAEKEHTRRGDELAAQRRALPWVRVDKRYLFDTSAGVRRCTTPTPATRGLDAFNATFQLLDRAPRGRDEDALPVPVAWVRRHDEYGQAEPAPAG